MNLQLTKVGADFKLNRFGQTVAHVANIKLKRSYKKGSFIGYPSVVLLMKFVQVQKMRTVLQQIIYLFVRIFCVNIPPSYSPLFKTSLSPPLGVIIKTKICLPMLRL